MPATAGVPYLGHPDARGWIRSGYDLARSHACHASSQAGQTGVRPYAVLYADAGTVSQA